MLLAMSLVSSGYSLLRSFLTPQNTDNPEIERLQKELSHWQAKYSAEKTSDLNEKAKADNRVLQLEREQQTLPNRITGLVREIFEFLKENPEPKPNAGELFAADSEQRFHKIHSGFSLRLYPKLEKIVFELGEQGIYDYSLNDLVNRPAHSDISIRSMAEKLIALRDKVEMKSYGGLQLAKPTNSLRDRVFDACRERQIFLQKYGKRPNPDLIPINSRDEFTRTYNDTVQAWDNKFQADYWKNYKEKIVNLRHELAVDGLTDDGLDKRLTEAETSALGEVTVREIDRNLRLLAARL